MPAVPFCFIFVLLTALALGPSTAMGDAASGSVFNARRIMLDPVQARTTLAELSFVRLAKPLDTETMDAIGAFGVELGPHVGGRVFLVRPDSSRTEAALDPALFSAWAPCLPEWRIEAEFARALVATDGPVLANILAWDARKDTRARLTEACRSAGVELVSVPTASRRFVVRASRGQLLALLRSSDVLWIDAWRAPQADMDIVRSLSGVSEVASVGGYSGLGVRGEVIDGGLRTTHADLSSRPPVIHRPGGSDFSHGTPVFGIIFGDGASDETARGILPDAQGIFAGYDFIGDRASHTQELLGEPYRAVFQSNSWGSGRTRTYTSVSAELDQIAFDTDLLIVQSQSNAGNQDSRPEAWAKNVLSVGGVVHENTLSMLDDSWSHRASVGPAMDGRVKPDLAHAYDLVHTLAGHADAAHGNFGGTSAATPIVAGCGGLAIQMFADGLFGNAVSGGDVFDERPHAATAKALLINSARQWPFGSAADELGRFRQGWGMPDVSRLFEQSARMLVVDQTDALEPFNARAFIIDVALAEPVLQATLVYPDPPGMPGSMVHTMNDLSLRVTAPDGTVYLGNYGLADSTTSMPGGVPDSINTVEQVIVADPLPGRWLVEVYAGEFSADGIPQTPEMDATYALVVSGGLPEYSDPSPVFPLGLPLTRQPFRPLTLTMGIQPGTGPVESARLEWRSSDGAQGSVPAESNNGGYVTVTVPPAACGTTTEFAIVIETDGQTVVWPEHWPASGYTLAAELERTFDEQFFDSDADWQAGQSPELTGGAWAWGPVAGGLRGDPPIDADGNGFSWLTDPTPGNSDVDGGQATLTSPPFDLSGIPDPLIRFAWWLSCDDSGSASEDAMQVEISADDGATWIPAATLRSAFAWREHTIDVGSIVGPAESVQLRFTIADTPNDSVTEAGVDHVRVMSRSCELACPADLNVDGLVDIFDVLAFLNGYADNALLADMNGDGVIDFYDLLTFLGLLEIACG